MKTASGGKPGIDATEKIPVEGFKRAWPPLDFSIGAHAEIMRWKLVTRDAERISKYFPKVHLLTPKK